MYKQIIPALALFAGASLFGQVAHEAGPHPGGERMMFVSTEFGFERNTVKGAPYSADAVTVTTQTLADGNRIVRRSTGSVARDSEGRTRREQRIEGLGPWAAGAELPPMIVINDPVAQTSFVLESKSHTARKASMAGLPATAAEHIAKLKAEASASGKTIEIVTRHSSGDSVSEDLGTRVIEGVQAEGKRTTRTVAAGEMGNEKPLQYLNEVWTSSDLHVIVMSRTVDPMAGETVYTLTNLQRGEPDAGLFRIPADYTVKEGPQTNIIYRK